MDDRVYMGELEQMVMWSVLRLAGDGYGPRVLRELEARTGRTLSPGALYATVDRLEEKGLLESRLGDPVPGRGGRRKRLLTATPAGVHALERTRTRWRSVWDGLGDAGAADEH